MTRVNFSATEVYRTGLRNLMSTVSAPVREISVAHSPDSDDAFMFYGLRTGNVRRPGLKFNHTYCDLGSLYRPAPEGLPAVTPITLPPIPHLHQTHPLIPHRHP